MAVGPLKISFSTLACPDWTWQDVLRYGPEFGYQGVEIRLLARETNLLAIADLAPSQWTVRQRELAHAGLAVCGLASSVRFDHSAESDRQREHETGCRYIELAVALGAGFIRVFGDTLPQLPDNALSPDRGPQAIEARRAGEAQRLTRIEQIAAGICRLAEVAATAGIDILLETHGDFSASPPAQQLMQAAAHPRVGLVWDTHHPWRFHGEPLVETWQRLRPWVRHTHWKDSVVLTNTASDRATVDSVAEQAGRQAALLMSGHRHADYVPFLGGEFPARECLQLLLDGGYTGWHSLEWEKMWHPELLPPEVILPLFPEKLRSLVPHRPTASVASAP